MRIAVGSDHAGFEEPAPLYKPEIIKHLEAKGHTIVDCGPEGPGSVDYPDYANRVSETLLNQQADRGILLCGTGIGVGMAANRHPGIRAATCATMDMVRLSREHNDANVLCLGRRILTLQQCLDFIDAWLEIPFSGQERHQRRVAKMG